MGGAGQWTLDHRRSLTPQEAGRQRRENRREKKRAKGKRHFKARPERRIGNDSNADRK